MPDFASSMPFLTRTVFLVENIILLYIFLTPARPRIFQALAFIAAWFATFILRAQLHSLELDTMLVSYICGMMYTLPCIFIFRETFQAKVFVFFMIYSLTQLTYVVFMYIDRFVSPPVPQTFVLTGLLLELAALPLIYRYARAPINDILGILNRRNPVFTLFPVLSFLLLACYGIQGNWTLPGFITLVLSTTIIFFAYYMIAVSISQTRRQHELERISMTDSLTGLYNRRYMESKLRDEYERFRRTGSVFSLVSADIDFFKKINDRYGHDCGDSLLQIIAKEMTGSVRPYDTVSRWGGEEFLILLPGTNSVNAVDLAERIRKAVETCGFRYNGEPVTATLTLGVAAAGQDDTVESLIKKADIALYHGKQNGRNCVISHDDI